MASRKRSASDSPSRGDTPTDETLAKKVRTSAGETAAASSTSAEETAAASSTSAGETAAPSSFVLPGLGDEMEPKDELDPGDSLSGDAPSGETLATSMGTSAGDTAAAPSHLVVFSDGAPSKGQGGACLHVTRGTATRASRFNLCSQLCVRHYGVQTIMSGWVQGSWSATFWELYGFLLGVELLFKYVRSSGREWSELSYTHFIDNVKAVEFLLEEILPEDVGPPHLAEMVRVCRQQLAYIRSRLRSCVIGQAFRHTPGIQRAHTIAHGPPTAFYTPSINLVSHSLRCMLSCYYASTEEERETMRQY